MSQGTPLLNVLAFSLPGAVTRPMYLEYNSRRKELDRIWSNPNNNYQELHNHVCTIEALLALSIFYRHVIGYMFGAVAFYRTVNQKVKLDGNSECAIKVGKTILDRVQQRHLQSAMITFGIIREKYQLDPFFFEYSETIQFLRNCKELFYHQEYEEDDPL